MKRFFIILAILILVLTLFGISFFFSKNDKVEYSNNISISGNIKGTKEAKIILHFSNWQDQFTLPASVRKARAFSQFLFYDTNGKIINDFSVNREILCNPIVKMNNSISIGYGDFVLLCEDEKIEFLDDETNLSLTPLSGFGPQMSGYIDKHDASYYLLNLGSRAISGQYTTMLRFVEKSKTYDIVIPYPICYISYDNTNDRFIYRVSDDIDIFNYGYINFDKKINRYIYNEPKNQISKKQINQRYNDESVATQAVFKNNFVYELVVCEINENLSKDFKIIGNSIKKDESQGVVLLYIYDLNKNDVSVKCIFDKSIICDSLYGFEMSGTQCMPTYVENETLYFFARNEKMYILDSSKVLREYNISFDFSETINSSKPFEKNSIAGPTMGDGSPLIINKGNIYTGHLYKDGRLKIHKYNFNTQNFELFWQSKKSILSDLKNKSIEFISFQIIE